MVNKTFTEWEMRNNFERKRGFIIVTAQGEIEWNKVVTTYIRSLTCIEGKRVNEHNLLGDIYIKVGNATKAIGEYLQAIEEFIKGRLFDDSIAICEKMLGILQCLSDVNKSDLPERYRILKRQP